MNKNKEYVKEYNRMYWERVKANPKLGKTVRASRRKAVRNWASKNPDRIKGYKEKYRRTVLKQQRLKARFEIFLSFNFACHYCGRKAPDIVLEIDHIIPRSKGGTDERTNLIPACRACNKGKSDILLESFNSDVVYSQSR